MEGEITLERHRGEISAQPRHYLELPKASRRQPLSDNKAPACPHRPGRRVDRRTWKNYWWADKLFCYPNSALSCFCPPVLCFCLSAQLHFDVSIYVCLAELLSLSLCSASLSLSLSPSASHCISVSVSPAFFLSHLWIIDVYRFDGKNRTVLEVTNGLANRLHPPLFKELES